MRARCEFTRVGLTCHVSLIRRPVCHNVHTQYKSVLDTRQTAKRPIDRPTNCQLDSAMSTERECDISRARARCGVFWLICTQVLLNKHRRLGKINKHALMSHIDFPLAPTKRRPTYIEGYYPIQARYFCMWFHPFSICICAPEHTKYSCGQTHHRSYYHYQSVDEMHLCDGRSRKRQLEDDDTA